jgi:hypothetical protein
VAIFDEDGRIDQKKQQASSGSPDGSPAAGSTTTAISASAHVGFIDPACDVREVILDAYENARFLADHHYCGSPPLHIDCINVKHPDEKIRVPLVPLHLYYVVFETIKVRWDSAFFVFEKKS